MLQGFSEQTLERGSKSSDPIWGLPNAKNFVSRTVEAVKKPREHLFDYTQAEKEYKAHMEKTEPICVGF